MPSLSLSPSLWESVKSDFKTLFPEDVFQMWFEPVVCLETIWVGTQKRGLLAIGLPPGQVRK